MRLKSFTIKKLFNLYNYYIPFEGNAHITLLTSPNGYGKTTILSIINNLAKGFLLYFYNLPFDEIIATFENDNVIIVEKRRNKIVQESQSDSLLSNQTSVSFIWNSANRIISFKLDEKLLKDAIRVFRYQNPVVDKFRFDLHDQELYEMVGKDEAFYHHLLRGNKEIEEFLLMLKSISTTFIPANRVYLEPFLKNEKKHFGRILPIEKVSESLRCKMVEEKTRYLQSAQQSIDSKFIEALLNSETEYSEEQYKIKVANLINKNNRLLKYNLSNKINFQEYSKGNARILSAYLDELEKQLSVYDSFLEKMDLLSDLIRNKGFANKTFSFSPVYGIRCVSSVGEYINLTSLSSGEQNELVLLYDLIFEVPDNSVLLLDEPENSLHVTWQRLFIDDLTRISELKRIQSIVATHSSRIVLNAKKQTWDLYYLNEEYDEE